MKPASDESKCDTLIREMGGAVIQFGRKGKRTPNTHGIPDRLYFVQNRMVWFEVKSANDYLRAAQIGFLAPREIMSRRHCRVRTNLRTISARC